MDPANGPKPRPSEGSLALIGSLEISLGALRHNAALLRELVGARRAAFVVKGNAYGHGLLPVARAIEPLAVRLCVYSVEEAIALREGGITAPMLVLGPIPPPLWTTRWPPTLRSHYGARGSSLDEYVRRLASVKSRGNPRQG